MAATRKSNASPAMIKKRQALFLEAFKRTGKINAAASAARIDRETVRKWRRDDVHGFKQRFEEADLDLTEELEDGAMQDARAGDVATRIFLLKARRPEKYRDHVKHEHGGEIKQRLVLVFPEDKK